MERLDAVALFVRCVVVAGQIMIVAPAIMRDGEHDRVH